MFSTNLNRPAPKAVSIQYQSAVTYPPLLGSLPKATSGPLQNTFPVLCSSDGLTQSWIALAGDSFPGSVQHQVELPCENTLNCVQGWLEPAPAWFRRPELDRGRRIGLPPPFSPSDHRYRNAASLSATLDTQNGRCHISADSSQWWPYGQGPAGRPPKSMTPNQFFGEEN